MAKDVKIEIVGDASKYKSTLADAGSASDKFATKTKSNGEQMSKFGLGALAVAGAVGVGLFKAGEAASNLGESVNAVQVTFGDAADGILKLGEQAATTVGLSNVAFNGLAVQFSNFAQTVAGKGGDVVGVMKDLTGRAGDFASVMNIEVKDAAVLFQSGLAGETEPLRKYGIDLSAAAVKAYAAATGIGTLGKELTESEKVTARYGLLMQSTSKDQGDFANTSGSAANATRIAKAEMENAAASLGQVVAPVIATVATKAASLASGFVNLNEKSGGLLVSLTALGGGGAALIGVITSVIGRVEKAREAFEKMGSAGKVLGVAMGVAAIAMTAYAIDAADTAKANVILKQSIEDLSKVSDADLMKTFVDTIVKGMFAEKGLKQTTDELANANLEGAVRVQAMIQAHIANGTATNNEKDAIGSLNKSIIDASVARKESAVATDAAKAKIEQTTVATDAATASTDEQKAAIDAAAASQKAYVDGALVANKELVASEEGVLKAHQDELKAQQDLADAGRAAVDAKYAYTKAEQSTKEAIEASTATLKDNKASENDKTDAVFAGVDAALTQAAAYVTLQGHQNDAKAANQDMITSLYGTATALAPDSPIRASILAYIADLANIPANVSTTVTTAYVDTGAVGSHHDSYTPSATTGKVVTSGNPQGTGFASGTDYASPGDHPVAEDGMELVIGRQNRRFRGGEQVIPTGKTAALLGAGSGPIIHQHFYGITGDSEVAKRSAREIGWELRK